MKRMLCLALTILLAITILGCNPSEDSIHYYSVYNKELGTVISVGMTKEKVDKLLGDSDKNAYYDYEGLSIEYDAGKVKTIILNQRFSPWVMKGGFYAGASVDTIFEALGEQDINHLNPDEYPMLAGHDEAFYGFFSYYLTPKGEDSIVGHEAQVTFRLNSDDSRASEIWISRD